MHVLPGVHAGKAAAKTKNRIYKNHFVAAYVSIGAGLKFQVCVYECLGRGSGPSGWRIVSAEAIRR